MISPDLIKQIRHIEIRTRRLVNDSFAGEYHAVFKGRGMEFDEVRSYTPGDDVRSIDWNVTARMGSPYIKRYVEERELTVMLLVDVSASGDFGSRGRFKRELAAELASVLVFCAASNNDKCGLMIFTDQVELYIPPRKGRRHMLRLVRDMLAYTPKRRGTDIRLALESVTRILKRRSIVFLISDFLAPAESYRRALFLANRRHDVITVDLNDPLEKAIPPAGLLFLEDAENGQSTWIDSSSRAFQDAFTAHVSANEQAKIQAFRSAGSDSIHIWTGEDYIQPLTAFFRQRANRLQL